MKRNLYYSFVFILGISLLACKKDEPQPVIPEGPYDRVKFQYNIYDSTAPQSHVSLTLQAIKVEYVNVNFNSTTFDATYPAPGALNPFIILLNQDTKEILNDFIRSENRWEDCDSEGDNCSTVIDYAWKTPDLIKKRWTDPDLTPANFNVRADLYVANTTYKYFTGNPSAVEFKNEAASGYNPKLCKQQRVSGCYREVPITYDRDVTVTIKLDLKDFH